MIEYTNECVGCPPEKGCLHDCCPYRNVKRLYCDNCDSEVDKLYELDGEQWCYECVVEDAFKYRKEIV